MRVCCIDGLYLQRGLAQGASPALGVYTAFSLGFQGDEGQEE